MRTRQFVTAFVLIAAVAATPAFAQEGRRRRGTEDGRQARQGQENRCDRGRVTGRAAPRDSVRPQPAQPPQAQRAPQPGARRNDQPRRDDGYRGDDNRRDDRGRYDTRRADGGRYEDRRGDSGRYVERGRNDDRGRFDNRSTIGRAAPRPYYPYYSNRGYGSRVVVVPRYVRPIVVNVVPYRPYRYRPSIAIGIYYGSGGSYPYGYTPRGYYDPLPGRLYGGLRITGFSHYAQVFADGYYVGIVDDFDGIFQHVNLEAGPHRIEIVEPGYDAFEFDVLIQPGRTTTFRY